MEISKTETDTMLQRDVICAYLGKQTTLWVEARARADRAEKLDPNLNAIERSHYRQIDAMLAELIEVPGVRDGV